MNIYSSVDGKNIDKIIVLFNSVYLNTKNKNLNFYLLIDKFPEVMPNIPDYLEDLIKIKEIKIDNKWKKLLEEFNKYFYKSASWCKNTMNFARFIFFQTFPEVDRVIYLDWDMIVLEDIYKLEPEYNNKEDMIVCSCTGENLFNNVFDREFKYSTNYKSLYAKNRRQKIKHHNVGRVLDFLGISYKLFFETTGFNAGFYIVSKEHFNSSDICTHIKKLIVLQKKFSCFNFGTQVVMNLMNITQRKFVDKKWNHLPILDDTISDLNDLYIIHWNGKKKPWNSISESNEIWYDYYLKVYPDYKDNILLANLKKFDINLESTDNKIVKVIKNNNTRKKSGNINLLKFLNSK